MVRIWFNKSKNAVSALFSNFSLLLYCVPKLYIVIENGALIAFILLFCVHCCLAMSNIDRLCSMIICYLILLCDAYEAASVILSWSCVRRLISLGANADLYSLFTIHCFIYDAVCLRCLFLILCPTSHFTGRGARMRAGQPKKEGSRRCAPVSPLS